MTRPALLTFDCYGTLIDWHGGLCAALRDLVGEEADVNRLAERYVALEREIEAGPYLPYREVMARTLERLMAEADLPLPSDRRDAFAESLPGWKPFPEVPTVLAQLGRHAPLAILSNIEDDLLDTSVKKLGVPIHARVTAQQVRSYKPSHAHFEHILKTSGLDKTEILHIAASLHHDIVPTRELGIPHLWINRRDEHPPDWLPAARIHTDLSPLLRIFSPPGRQTS